MERQTVGVCSIVFCGPLIKKPEEEERGSFFSLPQSQQNGLECVTVPLNPDPAVNRLNLQQQT